MTDWLRVLLAGAALLTLLTACSEDRDQCEATYKNLDQRGQASKMAYTREQWMARCEDDLGRIG